MSKRFFTAEEANQLVPWLASVFERLVPLRDTEVLHRERLDAIVLESRGNGGTSAELKLTQQKKKLSDCIREIRRVAQEIDAAGIIVRDLDQGLVDFPHLWNGREVYLCWVCGEVQIGYWHERDVGFTGRQRL